MNLATGHSKKKPRINKTICHKKVSDQAINSAVQFSSLEWLLHPCGSLGKSTGALFLNPSSSLEPYCQFRLKSCKTQTRLMFNVQLLSNASAPSSRWPHSSL